MKRYRQDYHVHTKFSVDSDANIETACQTAIARGLSEIAFTDHLDFGPDESSGYTNCLLKDRV
jgi:histidinol-phosphatase (PHP family)